VCLVLCICKLSLKYAVTDFVECVNVFQVFGSNVKNRTQLGNEELDMFLLISFRQSIPK